MDAKIPLPQFLKLLSNGNVPVAKAMVVAGKIYKDYGTQNQLSQLTDLKLKTSGIEDAGERKLVLFALRKAGYGPKRKATKRSHEESNSIEKTSLSTPGAGPSSPAHMTDVDAVITPIKRRRVSDKNEFLPMAPLDAQSSLGSFKFDEIFDENVLRSRFTIVNRAPVMTAWATIVAERMNFKRDEALSIASVYTEMNAVSKGVSLGLYDKKEQGLETLDRDSQPYVELIGRRPVFRTQDERWRALSNGDPVSPMTAFGYISRSFRQNVPYVMGAMRLLAESYPPSELNAKAWGLYAEFRPEVDQWGKRSQMSCSKILSLRRAAEASESTDPAIHDGVHEGLSLDGHTFDAV